MLLFNLNCFIKHIMQCAYNALRKKQIVEMIGRNNSIYRFERIDELYTYV